MYYTIEHDTGQDTFRPKILILDENPACSEFFRVHLSMAFPNTEIVVSNHPNASPGFDVYFINNQLNQKSTPEGELVHEIKEQSPQSLVVCLCPSLNQKRDSSDYIRKGFNLVYDAQNPENSQSARGIIKEYFNVISRNPKISILH